MAMREFFEHPLVNMLSAALVGGLASLVVSMVTIAPSQDRQMRLERLTAFSDSSDSLLSLGTEFVTKLNAREDLNATKQAIGNASAQQAIASQAVLDVFGAAVKGPAESYQVALVDFASVTADVQGPSEVKQWVVAYDGVVRAQRALKDSMRERLSL